MEDFLKKYIPEDSLRKELIAYQKFVVKDINTDYKEFRGNHKWKTYFEKLLVGDAPSQLTEEQTRYSVTDENTVHSWSEYATKVLWFGRRGGKNIYTSEIHEENC